MNVAGGVPGVQYAGPAASRHRKRGVAEGNRNSHQRIRGLAIGGTAALPPSLVWPFRKIFIPRELPKFLPEDFASYQDLSLTWGEDGLWHVTGWGDMAVRIAELANAWTAYGKSLAGCSVTWVSNWAGMHNGRKPPGNPRAVPYLSIGQQSAALGPVGAAAKSL